MPEIRLDSPLAWCALGPRPILMDGWFVHYLQGLFSDAARIENDVLKKYLWRRADSSNILIEMVETWKPQQTEQRPALLVKRNDWTTRHLGIGDKNMGAPTPDGQTHCMNQIQGSHTVFALSPKPVQANILGAEVYRSFNEFRLPIQRSLALKRFVTVGQGALVQVEECQQVYATPVTVAYIAEEVWKLEQEAPFLKTISLSALLPG